MDSVVLQVPRQDEGVAAVVPRAAQQQDAAGLEVGLDVLQDPEQAQPGVFHQDYFGQTESGAGAPIDVTHLLRCQDFHARRSREVAHFTQVGARNQATARPPAGPSVDSPPTAQG